MDFDDNDVFDDEDEFLKEMNKLDGKKPKKTPPQESDLEELKKEIQNTIPMEEIEESEDEPAYKDFKFNFDAIDKAIKLQFGKIDKNIHNKISPIHKNINFYYNSLNLCLGKQGSGKTTLLMKELIKLDTLPDQGNYDKIIYVTNGGGSDETFNKLSVLLTHIPIYNVDFTEVVTLLEQYFDSRPYDDTHHIFVILEDATFLLLKETNNTWGQWITKLRHLRMTVWINIHVWKSINTAIKTQVTCSFIFKGYNKENVSRIYSQSSIANLSSQNFFALYQTLQRRQCLKVDNFQGVASIIN